MFDRLLSIVAWVVVVFLIVPLVVIIGASFTTTPYVTFPPRGFTLQWYQQLASHKDFIRSFIDSIIIGFIATAGAVLIGTPAAIGLRLGSVKGQTFLRSVVMAPLTLPTIVTGVALLQIYYTTDLDLPVVGIIIGHVLVTVPYFVRTLGAGLEAVDPIVIEAAESLGASRVLVLRRVMLPAVAPSIFAGMIFVFITSFDQVTMSIFFSNATTTPLPIRIYSYIEFAIDPMIAALSTVLIAFAFAMVITLQKILGLERAFGA
jgi:putative spermidine/putrescine transport system permease protein